MQWKELLGYDVKELKDLSDAKLLEIFGPSLSVTRPDRAPRIDTKKPQTSLAKAKTAKANDMLLDLGFDINL